MANDKSIYSGADALDWDEAARVTEELIVAGRIREAMLLACGCYLGLRISDILILRWSDIIDNDTLCLDEKKTGKMRRMRINPTLSATASKCFALSEEKEDAYIFNSQMHGGRRPMTRQRAAQLLKRIAAEFGIKSAGKFSTHSLRKTFGRRVWLQACERGKGDVALQLLCDVFGHSSISITKRYLGIRQEEILSVYDAL